MRWSRINDDDDENNRVVVVIWRGARSNKKQESSQRRGGFVVAGLSGFLLNGLCDKNFLSCPLWSVAMSIQSHKVTNCESKTMHRDQKDASTRKKMTGRTNAEAGVSETKMA